MRFRIFDTSEQLGESAAEHVAEAVRRAIRSRRSARVIAATGAAQFTMLEALRRQPGVDWGRVTFFHLDEYIGLPDTHPASFRRYLRERIVEPLNPGHFEFANGTAPDPEAECLRLERAIREQPIDLAIVGVGENGHLAFNDPPADFDTQRAYLVVNLDQVCRQQQVGEGWFATLDEVPTQALSMSIPQILEAAEIVAVVPEARKARAVHECFDLPVSPQHPASALQRHGNVTVYLDRHSASGLQQASSSR